MSPPPTTTLALAARAASASTTAPTPATTCNREAMPDLFQIDGLPQKRSVWAIPNWPESLAGMTACCNLKPDNEVHMGGPDGCALWCLIPDQFLFEQVDDGKGGKKNGKRWDSQVVGSAMGQCVEDKGNVTGPHIAIWQVKEGAAAAGSAWLRKMSMKTVIGAMAWVIVVVGLLA